MQFEKNKDLIKFLSQLTSLNNLIVLHNDCFFTLGTPLGRTIKDGLDTVQLVLVVFFLGALVHLQRCILTLAQCGSGGCIFMLWR